MLAFVVSTRRYRIALAFAPLEDSIITKFFRPMVKVGLPVQYSYYPIEYIWQRKTCEALIYTVSKNFADRTVMSCLGVIILEMW